jgi:GNAT superfamily N-acetyltransferase
MARVSAASTPLSIRPLTPEVWPALEDLFGARGPAARCWCMYPLIGAAYRRRTGDENRAVSRKIVESGPPPGLLAFHGALAVGWCRLSPRDAVPALDRMWRLRRIDDTPVWSLSCLYVRIGFRREGVTAALIAAAIETARRAGAPALEAYPLDARESPSATSTGYATTFLRAGFKEVARRTKERPVMRMDS